LVSSHIKREDKLVNELETNVALSNGSCMLYLGIFKTC
jgi:hypothetical protein